MNIEDLRLHAPVLSSDGHRLGTLARFIFETESLRLTHIAVDTGILRSGQSLLAGGWGLSHDRTVPVQAVEHADSDAVRLTMTAEEFRDHSVDYIEEYFEQVPDDAPGRPDASDLRRLSMSLPGEPGPYLLRQSRAMPVGTEEISRDAPVWRLRPHQKIGEVERALLDEDSGRIAGLVVRRGIVFTRDVVLAPEHIVEVVGGIVRVQLDDETLRSLPEYEDAE